MKPLLVTCSIVLLLSSCGSKKEGSDFTEYLNQLPTLSLPLNLKACNAAALQDTALFRKFKNKESQKPCGKVTLGDSVILLIDDASFGGKLIRTFTKKGLEIEAKRVIHGSSYYHGNRSIRTAIIDGKGKIISTDSTTENYLRISKREWGVTRDGRFTGGNKIDIDSITIRTLTVNFLNWHFDTTQTKLQFTISQGEIMTLNYEDQLNIYKNFGFSPRFLKNVKQKCNACQDAIKSLIYADYRANEGNFDYDAYAKCLPAIDWVRMPDPKYCGKTVGYEITDVEFEPHFPGYDIPPDSPCVVIRFDVEQACGVTGLVEFKQIGGNWKIDKISSIAALYGE